MKSISFEVWQICNSITGTCSQSPQGRVQNAAFGPSSHVERAHHYRCYRNATDSALEFILTNLQKLALAHRRGSAFALAVELIELGLL